MVVVQSVCLELRASIQVVAALILFISAGLRCRRSFLVLFSFSSAAILYSEAVASDAAQQVRTKTPPSTPSGFEP